MKQEKLIEVLREMINKLSFLLEKVNQNFEKETLQELKPVMKRFREFLQLLQLHVADDNLEMPRSLKQLFYISGKTLNAYHEIASLELNITENEGAIKELQADIQQYKADWKKHFSSKSLPKLQSKLVNVKYDSVPLVALSNFFNVRAEISFGEHETEITEDETDVIKRHIRELINTPEPSKRNRVLVG